MERRTIIPAWSTLDRPSVLALLARGNSMPKAIQVAAAVLPSMVLDVPTICAARLMLERAKSNGGLMMTKGGALARVEVNAIFEAIDWPDFDRATVLAVNRVLNEADVLPILFTRMIAHEARLLRRYKGRLLVTKLGLELLAMENAPRLFRALFETTFWRVNLAFFDVMPADHWPQTHIGVVFWSLAVAAHEWADPEHLLGTCTMPDESFAELASDIPAFAMVTRALRPLTWFGLMERKETGEEGLPEWMRGRLYRKLPLFDRALAFSVGVSPPDQPLQ